MSDYFDTGVLLKLYTAEPESAAVRAFVQRRTRALPVTDLHMAECVSALRLKQFRGEASGSEAARALQLWNHDLRVGVLRLIGVDWNVVWSECRDLADSHASSTGCRTLDTLHIASARVLGFQRLVTSDHRQSAMAKLAGLATIDPVTRGG
ncbi:MAG: type II toxin-antitoxin system VapC family toxin [Verrucomicrobiales bacterium]